MLNLRVINTMREYKYTSTFAAAVKCVISEEKDFLLAKASLDELKKSIPNLPSDNEAFLPVAFPAFVANRVNKNDDVIDTETALAIYQKFINNPTNIEHKRHNVVGVIVSAGFTEFGTDKPLTYEQVKNLQTPFCVTLGAVVWKVINPEFAELLEESNDPTSDDFMGISASWELGFQQYKIVELDKNQKNIFGGKIISDASEVEKLSKMLRINGGTGVLEDKRIYRMPTADVFPLGIGFTQKPAADVKGIATNVTKEEHIHASEHYSNQCSCGKNLGGCRCSGNDKKLNIIENGCDDCKAALSGTPAYDFYFCPKCQTETPKGSKSLVINPYGHIQCPQCNTTSNTTQWSSKPSKSNPKLKDDSKNSGNISPNNIIKDITEKNIVTKSKSSSQTENFNVIERNNKFMTFKSINDITDEKIQQAVAGQVAIASPIAELISAEIQKGNSTWLTEKNQFVTQRQETEAKLAAASKKQEETEKSLNELKDTVASLQKEKVEREAVENFNGRMSQVMAEYEFDDEQSEAIAAEIRELKSNEEFTKWETKAKKLFKPFKKKDKSNDKDSDDADKSDAAMKKDGAKDAGKGNKDYTAFRDAHDPNAQREKGKDKTNDTKHEDSDESAKAAKSKDGEANPLGKEAKASIVDNAIDNGKKDGAITNTQTAQPLSFKEKYASAFAMENIIVTRK